MLLLILMEVYLTHYFKSSMIEYFYCKSYPILLLALKANLKKHIVIITPSQDIKKACEYLSVKVLMHKEFSIKEIILKRKEVFKEIERIKIKIGNSIFHFSHTQYALFEFILLNELRISNNYLYFHNFEILYEQPKIIHYFKREFLLSVIIKILISLRYFVNLKIRMNSNIPVISLCTDFIHRVSIIKEYTVGDYYDEVYSLFNNHNYNIDIDFKYLFISQDIFNKNIFKQDRILELINFLKINNFVIKHHPNLRDFDKPLIMETIDSLPEFLPVELYFRNFKGFVVSIFSMAVLTASRFDNITAISLIDLDLLIDKDFEGKIRSEWQNQSKNLLMPSSFEELENVLQRTLI